MTGTAVVRLFAHSTLPALIPTCADHGSIRDACPCRRGAVCLPVDVLFSRTQFHCRLSPVDAILTRMGAYDNMFSNASTFKVELDEWSVLLQLSSSTSLTGASCKILRDATPRSLVILDGEFGCTDEVCVSPDCPFRTWERNLDFRMSFLFASYVFRTDSS